MKGPYTVHCRHLRTHDTKREKPVIEGHKPRGRKQLCHSLGLGGEQEGGMLLIGIGFLLGTMKICKLDHGDCCQDL